MLFFKLGDGSENDKLPEFGTKLSPDDIKNFAEDVKKIFTSQYEGFFDKALSAFVEYENMASKVAYVFGGSRAFAQDFKESMIRAELSVKQLGGNFTDIENITLGVNDAMGELGVLTTETYTDLYATVTMTNGGLDITQASVTKIVDMFTSAGYNLKNIGFETTKVFNVAKEAGVNAVKVFDQIESNLSKINLFNFKNGIEGMAQMGAHAVSMKIKMEETLKIADELFNPEKAVQMAADFQRLGVSVTSLLNPYELQDMARNDPKRLQEALGEAMSQLTYFNESTQKMELYDYAKPLIRQIQQATGISLDYLMNVGLQTGELKKKMAEIEFPDFAKDEKTRGLIAQMATLGKMGGKYEGQYTVTIDGMEKAVEELSAQDWKTLEAKIGEQQEPAKDMVQLQKDTNGHLLNLINEVKALQGFFPRMVGTSATVSTVINTGARMGSEYVARGAKLMGIDQKEVSPGGSTVYDPTPIFTRMKDPQLWQDIGGTFVSVFQTALKDGIDATTLKKMGEDLGKGIEDAFTKMFPDLKTKALEWYAEGTKALTDILSGKFQLPNIPSLNSFLPSTNTSASAAPVSSGPAAVNYATYLTSSSAPAANTGSIKVSNDPNNPLTLTHKFDPAELANYVTKSELTSSPFLDKLLEDIDKLLLQRMITYGSLTK